MTNPYKILSAKNEEALQELVWNHMIRGWRLQGGVSVAVVHKETVILYQAMTWSPE